MERTKDLGGEFSPGHHFSDLYVQCLKLEFSGAILLWDEDAGADGRIHFRDGKPYRLDGERFEAHRLGEVLAGLGKAEDAAISEALQSQKSRYADTPIGALLVREAFLEESTIHEGLATQIQRRLGLAFGIRKGMWRGQWAKDTEEIARGFAIDGWRVLVPALRAHASSAELTHFSDAILGNAIKLNCSVESLIRFGTTAADEHVLRLLETPRKPDQLERAVGDRQSVRGLLKGLSLGGALELLPAAKGVPIGRRKTAGVKSEDLRPSRNSEAPPPPPPPKSEAPPGPSEEALALSAEIDALLPTVAEKNHFDLLGVKRSADGAQIRASYTQLVRRYHPDALAQKGLAADQLARAAELSSKLNDAYKVLSSPSARADYEKLLDDARVGGSERKKAALDDAEKRFMMAQVLLKQRDWGKAREMFTACVDAVPNDGRFKTYLAWSLWQDPSLMQDVVAPRVMELLAKAIEEAPDYVDGHYYYAVVSRVTGDIARATKHFKRAVELKPSHHEAVRELRLIRMRAQKK